MNLQQLLEHLEERIDPARAAQVERLHIDAMDFKNVARPPITVGYPVDPRITPFPYSSCFEDPAKMLYNELAALDVNVLNSVEIGDDYPLQIRPNYGIGVLCSLFGLSSRIVEDNMPWVEHLDGLDALRKAIDRGVPDVDAALGGKVRICCEYFLKTLSHYPKCAAAIHVTQPDLQGPFDILHLMLGGEMFYALYDEPELMHDALRLISQTYIRYHRFILPYTTGLVDGGTKCVVHRAIYGGRLVLKDDTATATLSESMYAEFVAPYNTQILRALASGGGGREGSIHFCGERKPWHYRQMLAQPLNCLNFGNPELHEFEKTHAQLFDERVCTVGLGQQNGYDLVSSFMDGGVRTGATLLVNAASRGEALDILRRHRSQ